MNTKSAGQTENEKTKEGEEINSDFYEKAALRAECRFMISPHL